MAKRVGSATSPSRLAALKSTNRRVCAWKEDVYCTSIVENTIREPATMSCRRSRNGDDRFYSAVRARRSQNLLQRAHSNVTSRRSRRDELPQENSRILAHHRPDSRTPSLLTLGTPLQSCSPPFAAAAIRMILKIYLGQHLSLIPCPKIHNVEEFGRVY